MVRLVDDLMEVSRISRGKIELRKESVELATVLRNAIETSCALIETAGNHLTTSLPAESLTLNADPVRLAQVISNLLNNAAKYTDEGGQIRLTAHRDKAHAVVSIRDNGIGISKAMLPKIFDLFAQGEHAHDRALGGLGIGLTLVRSLVEMHGGSIEAKSDGPGQGSEFVIRLPVSARQGSQTDRDRQVLASDALVGLRILVVDDNRDAGDSLGILLELLGAEVCAVRDGPTALATLTTYRPDVVLLDIGMPSMDGYEVARRIRGNLDSDKVTLIALTGWRQEEDRRRSKEAGIDHHLVKPVNMQVLQRILAPLATKRSAG
jgi:CheY-like chemotaxis protein/two-component sensor histidine kinase